MAEERLWWRLWAQGSGGRGVAVYLAEGGSGSFINSAVLMERAVIMLPISATACTPLAVSSWSPVVVWRYAVSERNLLEASCGPSAKATFARLSFLRITSSQYCCHLRAVVAVFIMVSSVFVLPLRPLLLLRRLQSRSSIPRGSDAYVPPASPYPEAIVAV